MRLFTPDYGPYDDRYRLMVVDHAKTYGVKKTKEVFSCSEASIRVWSKIISSGTITVQLNKE